ncbi:hypothetical protein O9929_14490 [Vibrio lentus]|nr:hypothetical protein [Vibrio lentus]
MTSSNSDFDCAVEITGPCVAYSCHWCRVHSKAVSDFMQKDLEGTQSAAKEMVLTLICIISTS